MENELCNIVGKMQIWMENLTVTLQIQTQLLLNFLQMN